MNVTAIATKDFRDARRSRMLWGATALLAFFFTVFLVGGTAGSGEMAALSAINNLIGAGAFFLPLIVIVMGYLAIAGERESGSVKYLLGLPNSRRSVLLGKFLGRAGVALVAVSVGLLASAVMVFVQFSALPVEEFLTFAAMTLYLALVYVAVAVGVSAACTTRGRAMAGTVGIYFLFSVVWIMPSVNPMDSVAYLVEDLLGLDPMPNLYEFVFNVSPSFAYAQATTEFVGIGTMGPNAGQTAGDVPFYLTEEFMLVILAAWIVVPLAIGYLRFRNSEIG